MVFPTAFYVCLRWSFKVIMHIISHRPQKAMTFAVKKESAKKSPKAAFSAKGGFLYSVNGSAAHRLHSNLPTYGPSNEGL